MEQRSQTALFEVFSQLAERLAPLPQVRVDTVLAGLYIQSRELLDEAAGVMKSRELSGRAAIAKAEAIQAGAWHK